MAGIYIHIPFCKQACNYCDFHFSTSLKKKGELVKAIIQEADLRKNYLENEKVESIYFGGGTPSLLIENELKQILEGILKNHTVSENAEITFEANPDDLQPEKLIELRNSGINRLSIGIQSFFDEDLKWMNRAHNSEGAHAAIKNSLNAGFDNISIDLIYGSPTTTGAMWEKNLEHFFAYNLPHLSSYSLTVESRTKLAHDIAKGKTKAPDDEDAVRQYQVLQEKIAKNNYEQYEVSNFCRDGFYSKHNSSYWKNIKYLGLGPSAHSFNGKSRQWNIANNSLYINSLDKNIIPMEIETLSERDKFNEYLMTMLRTKWGVDLNYLKKNFDSFLFEKFLKSTEHRLIQEKCLFEENFLKIPNENLIYSDRIIRQLFLEQEE